MAFLVFFRYRQETLQHLKDKQVLFGILKINLQPTKVRKSLHLSAKWLSLFATKDKHGYLRGILKGKGFLNISDFKDTCIHVLENLFWKISIYLDIL